MDLGERPVGGAANAEFGVGARSLRRADAALERRLLEHDRQSATALDVAKSLAEAIPARSLRGFRDNGGFRDPLTIPEDVVFLREGFLTQGPPRSQRGQIDSAPMANVA